MQIKLNLEKIDLYKLLFSTFFVTLTIGYVAYYFFSGSFQDSSTVPAGEIIGGDFEIIAREGHNFLMGLPFVGTGHPPLENILLGLFKLFFGSKYAYFIFIIFSLLCFLASIFIANRITSAKSSFHLISFLPFIFVYPILFNLERGNTDSISLLFIVLFIFFSQKKNIFLASTSMFIAYNLKIYPIVFLPIFLIHFGVLRTCALAFIIQFGLMISGIEGLMEMIKSIGKLASNPYIWDGNHSAISFAKKYFPNKINEVANLIIVGLTISLIGITLDQFFYRRRPSHQNTSAGERKDPLSIQIKSLIGLMFISCSLIPGTSHDYRLLIQVAPWLLILSNSIQISEKFNPPGWLQNLDKICFFGITIATSSLFFPRNFFLDKTALLLVMAGCYLTIYLSQIFQRRPQ